MDKSWMDLNDRRQPAYINGVNDFLDFAFTHSARGNNIRCPCHKCGNIFFHTRDIVFGHLLMNGIIRTYKWWSCHGEDYYINSTYGSNSSMLGEDEQEISEHDDMQAMLDDFNTGYNNMNEIAKECNNDDPNEAARKFYDLLKDAEKELYPGCKEFSKFQFLVTLLTLKTDYGWTDRSFTELLKVLKRAIPFSETLPSSFYEAKNYMQELGMGCKKIDACLNDCILYRGKFADYVSCPTCGTSRWQSSKDTDNTKSNMLSKKSKNIPNKILRHFPLIPRLQRLYMCSRTAKEMRWHKEKRCDDGKLRHPADAFAWKSFDRKHQEFSSDARNLRLGLASDGFNPFGLMSTNYSVWPVVLVPYNMPPWMCMKTPNFIISLIIPGPGQPGNDMDVYLQPLIDELKLLWEVGVCTYDAYGKSNFNMHAALLWTINDFPAYANLSGWSTKGKLACPCCNKDTWSCRLRNGFKMSYMGNRRFLDPGHRWRKDKKSFDGTIETRSAPKDLSGDEILEQLKECDNVIFGKHQKKRKQDEVFLPYNWKKLSIFFQLPYWRTLEIRHCLDYMHILKNVTENILGTMLNIDGKTKDDLSARLDLKEMGLKAELHPIEKDGYYIMPQACYTLTLAERRAVCHFLENIKVPDGYSSNIRRCVNSKEGKVSRMKAHDCHVFMQDQLAPAFRGIVRKEVYDPLVELSLFFKELGSKTLTIEVLDRLESNIPITLCKLEKIFPPSFFTIMMHLPIHLAREAKIAGPIHYRWMYPIERYLRTLKSFVRNKARPEGSMANGYLVHECLTFCSRYMSKVETKLNRPTRNDEGNDIQDSRLSIFQNSGRSLGKGFENNLTYEDWHCAQLYILRNCPDVEPFIKEHQRELEQVSSKDVGRRHESAFVKWFELRASKLYYEGDLRVNTELLQLARGPMKGATHFTGYIVNGFRFHTYDREIRRKTQNSGIIVKGDEQSGGREYYGVLKDVIQLDYGVDFKIVLFKCEWWDTYHEGKGYKKDKNGIISINVKHNLRSNEPYVLACQVEQVYYVADNKNKDWRLVIKTTPRHFYDFPSKDNEDFNEEEIHLYDIDVGLSPLLDIDIDDDDTEILLQRTDVEAMAIKKRDQSCLRRALNEEDIDDDIIDDSVDDVENGDV